MSSRKTNQNTHFKSIMMADITIKLEGDKRVIKHFMSWLCGQGEQDYWMWMEHREQETKANITAVRFDYDFNGAVITAEVGRLDDEA